MIYHLRQTALILNNYVRKWDKLSHIFLAFFERIHGKIYMRKIKKKGVNVDENNRFEQLSLFELCMGDDESSGGEESSEGKKQSIIYHFEGE